MSILLAAGGAALFAAGAGAGVGLTLIFARTKLKAMTAAAEEANAIIANQSEGALKDLAEAHAKAEAMIDAIETAKLSTARAETSVNGLIANIHRSRENLEKVGRLEWFQSALRDRAQEPRVVQFQRAPGEAAERLAAE